MELGVLQCISKRDIEAGVLLTLPKDEVQRDLTMIEHATADDCTRRRDREK